MKKTAAGWRHYRVY